VQPIEAVLEHTTFPIARSADCNIAQMDIMPAVNEKTGVFSIDPAAEWRPVLGVNAMLSYSPLTNTKY
jgi:hypothetical protein